MSEPKKLRELLAEMEGAILASDIVGNRERAETLKDFKSDLQSLVAALAEKVQKFRECAERRIQHARNSSTMFDREITDARAEIFERCADELECGILGPTRGTGDKG